MMEDKEFFQTYDIDFRNFSKGGYAFVYRGRHKRLGMDVVFKMLKRQANVQTMLHEVEVLKRVSHRCLPRVLDAVEFRGQFYSVIEFIPGDTLNKFIKNRGPVSYDMLRGWSESLCSALSALHNCTDAYGRPSPIIHADIKPDNLIIRSGSLDPVLIDFNISSTNPMDTLTGLSPAYSPPELVQAYYDIQYGRPNGSRPNKCTDLYSLGTILFFAATGQVYSYTNPNWNALRQRGIPETYILWLRGLLQSDASARFQTVEDAWRALKQVGSVEQEVRAIRDGYKKGLILLWCGVLCGLLMIGGGAWMLVSQKNRSYETVQTSWQKLYSKGEYAEAAAEAQRMEEMEPDRLESAYYTAKTRYMQGDYTGAIIRMLDGFDNASQKGSSAVKHDSYKLLADAYEHQNNIPETIRYYEMMRSENLLETADIRDYAGILVEQKKHDQANKLIEGVALGDADLNYIQARNHRPTDKKKAADYMSNCLSIASDDDLLIRAGLLLAKWEREDKAPAKAVSTLEYVQSAITSDTTPSPEFYRLLAQSKMDLAASTRDASDISSALASIDQIIEKKWDTADVWNSKAAFECALEKYDQARMTISKMESYFGESRMSKVRSALIEYAAAKGSTKADDYKKFKDAYTKALATEGDDNDPDYKLMVTRAGELEKKGLLK